MGNYHARFLGGKGATRLLPYPVCMKGNDMNNEDLKLLDLLALFHYIAGGIIALFSCLPFLQFIGIDMISENFFEDSYGFGGSPFMGWIFMIMGTVYIVLGWSMAVCIILAGKKLKKRKSRLFCMVIAGIECMFMPFGTILGIFTLIVLNKDSIKGIFAE